MQTQPRHFDEGQAHRQPRGRRAFRRLVFTVVAIVAATYVGVGWYVSGEIIDGLRVDRSDVVYDTDVVEVDDSTIVLVPSEESSVGTDRDAVMGLRWEGGYGQVGPAASVENGTETRPFILLEGSPPPVGEDVADFDSFAFPDDPSVFGVEFNTVTYPGPMGDLQAWEIPGGSDVWIVAVHGRAADRTEFLRLIDSVEDLDHPLLVIRYRNDEGAPQTGDSLLRLGQEEWEDVDAAVEYAVSRGAESVVLAGASMGGGIALSYAMEAPPGLVRGMILEAPAASLRRIVDLRSGEALPIGGPVGESFLVVGRLFVRFRAGIDFDRIDYIDRAEELDMPILLFQGADDTTVPPAIGEQLSAARPDLVEFHPVSDAAHVRAWNEDPEEYRAVVTEFLQRIRQLDNAAARNRPFCGPDLTLFRSAPDHRTHDGG